MEHSPITLATAAELIREVSLSGVCPLVRLSSNDSTLAKRVLDAGAAGIIVPMVNSAAMARAAVAAAKYPPQGIRSVGLSRAQAYGPEGFDDYFARANAEILVVVQIEHVEAVANADAILGTPGVDGYIIGPYDLSASMGKAGQFGDPDVVDALARVRAAATDRGVWSGFHYVDADPQGFLARAAEGFAFVAYSADFILLGSTCRRDVALIRARLDLERP
jgi:2-keto-3-deoxy-L-rhamnonate aldolase RhmA